MVHRTRLKYTDEVKSYIWDRYQQGDALKAIGRSCDRTSSARLIKCAEMIHELDLSRYEIGMNQFALSHERAARVVKKANNLRMDFIRKAFSELGFAGDDLEMRTMLFACYHAWEAATFPRVSRKRRKELIGKRLDLLTANFPL